MPKELVGVLDGKGKRFAIVVSRFNDLITKRLFEGACDCLRRHGVKDDDITVAWVPGSYEIPPVAKRLAAAGKADAVICLGAVIRGETPHFDHVAGPKCGVVVGGSHGVGSWPGPGPGRGGSAVAGVPCGG